MRWFRKVSAELVPAQPEAAPAASLLGGRYRLSRSLGRGASSEVLLAIDTHSGQRVAVKLMSAGQSGTPLGYSSSALISSNRETQAAARLNHVGIARVIDVDPAHPPGWLVMELAYGMPLSRYTQPSRLLPEVLVFQIGARIAEALAHAHAQGVVHRDLKPANVLVDLPNLSVKLLDFGVARIDDGQQTRTGMTVGTPAYMAPEQLAGQAATPASDVYALGVMLFELLTGRRPHEAASLGELLRAVAHKPAAELAPLRPDLPPTAVQGVQQALATNPAKRPQDLVAYAADLSDLATAVSLRGPRNGGALTNAVQSPTA